MKKKNSPKTLEQAYWRFIVRVGTSNVAKPTKDVEAKIRSALQADSEILTVHIEEKYD